MGRKVKDGIPGSIYANRDKLIIKIRGQCFFTGLDDSFANRKICENLKKQIYFQMLGLDATGSLPQKKKQAEITFEKAFEEFLKFHCANLAPKTIINYKNAFKAIAINPSKELSAFNIDDFALKCTNRVDISEESINIYLHHFQVFLNFCVAENWIDTINILKKYKHKPDKKPIRIFEDHEATKLIDYFNAKDKQFSLLIQFLLCTGARIGEALNLTSANIRDDRIFFGNKITNELEFIPISDDIREVLNQLPKEGKLFSWAATSYSRLSRRLADAMSALKIPKDERSFHEFRKTFLYRLFRADVTVQQAQRLMRHKTISITIRYYTYYDDQTLIDNLNKIKSVSH